MTATEVITQGASAAVFAKVLVEVVKMTLPNMPRNFIPLWAFLLSEVSAFALAMTSEATVFNRATVAAVFLVGVGATATAIGISAAQNRADKVDERIETALQLQPGSTKSDVDEAVSKK